MSGDSLCSPAGNDCFDAVAQLPNNCSVCCHGLYADVQCLIILIILTILIGPIIWIVIIIPIIHIALIILGGVPQRQLQPRADPGQGEGPAQARQAQQGVPAVQGGICSEPCV